MTIAKPLRRALTTNSTSTAFTAKVPTATEPSGAGVFNVFDRDIGIALGSCMPSHLLLIPFGTAANNATFDMRLWAWSKVHAPDIGDHAAWVPFPLLDLSIVCGNIAGIGASEFLADTITVNKGAGEELFRNLVSPANDTPANIAIHLRGCQKFEFDFDSAGAAPATAMNCYWRALDQV